MNIPSLCIRFSAFIAQNLGLGNSQQLRSAAVEENMCILMLLQNRCRALRRNLAFDHVVNRLRLGFARGDQDDSFRLHDAVDAHCQRIVRHIGIREEALVRFQRALCERYLVCSVREFIRWLVKANVAVIANAEQLQIDAACRLDARFVLCALRFFVRGIAVEEVHTRRVDIRMAEQIRKHKGIVAVFVVSRQIAVFIEVEGRDIAKNVMAIPAEEMPAVKSEVLATDRITKRVQVVQSQPHILE